MKKVSNISVRLISLLFVLLLLPPLMAQQLKAHKGTVKNAYNYWFYMPAKTPTSGTIRIDSEEAKGKKPLVIFLHGASLCGRNLERVRRYGTLDALRRGLKIDAYVLAPQNSGGSWEPAKVNRLVDWAISKYDVDTTRIYVLGMSLGGYGTIDYTAASPNRVAAAMALCGGATTKKLSGLCRVPLCIMHGTGDRAVTWQQSQSVVNAMRAAGDTSRLIYKLIPKASHGDLARYLYSPEVYTWLFRHSLSDRNRPVNRQYRFNYANLRNVYRELGQPNQIAIAYNESEEEAALVQDLPAAELTANVQDAPASIDPSTVFDGNFGYGGPYPETSMSQSPAQDSNKTSSGRSKNKNGARGTHKVRQGDTLSKISRRYHVSIDHLCKVNHISRTSTLSIGQKIKY